MFLDRVDENPSETFALLRWIDRQQRKMSAPVLYLDPYGGEE
jgi:hypothetical protein